MLNLRNQPARELKKYVIVEDQQGNSLYAYDDSMACSVNKYNEVVVIKDKKLLGKLIATSDYLEEIIDVIIMLKKQV